MKRFRSPYALLGGLVVLLVVPPPPEPDVKEKLAKEYKPKLDASVTSSRPRGEGRLGQAPTSLWFQNV